MQETWTRGRMVRALGLVLALFAGAAVAQVDLDRHLKPEQFGELKISPTGEFYAVTVRLPDRVALVIMRRADKQVTAKVVSGPHSEIGGFWWANDERVVVAMAERIAGSRDAPWLTGELHAVNADGSQGKVVVSNTDRPSGTATGAVDLLTPDWRAAQLVGLVPGDPRHVMVSVFSAEDTTPLTRLEKLDLYSTHRSPVAAAPVRRASFVLDPTGEVRFALGAGDDNASKLYYRDTGAKSWRLVNDENQSKRVEIPLGYSADGKTAYLQVEQPEGPDAVVTFDPVSGARKTVLRDALVDPSSVVRGFDQTVALGVRFDGPEPHTEFFDPDSKDALMLASVAASFPDEHVAVTSQTRDGNFAVLAVYGPRNAGDFYLYDRRNVQANAIFSRRLWIDPATAAPTRPIAFTARDGLQLHGFLTTPPGKTTGPLPLLVLPHGGPITIYDSSDYNEEAQILADAGYAVLRVNYHGSGNYGRKFLHAGERQWGRAMQDDLTDATRWAIAEKIADPAKIFLYGASYGAYAAMMGLAHEPELYRCGVGYVGVYDLPMMVKGSRKVAAWVGEWNQGWVGAPSELAGVSPVNLASQIKAPVLLAAGGKDDRAPIEHSKKLEKAILASGGKVETLYYPTEGHGFYSPEHVREYYVRVLDFLSRQLGGAKAK